MTRHTIHVVGVSAPNVWDVLESANRFGFEPVCVDNVGGADPELPALTAELDVTDRSVDFVIGTGSSIARRATAVATKAANWVNPVSLVDRPRRLRPRSNSRTASTSTRELSSGRKRVSGVSQMSIVPPPSDTTRQSGRSFTSDPVRRSRVKSRWVLGFSSVPVLLCCPV